MTLSSYNNAAIWALLQALHQWHNTYKQPRPFMQLFCLSAVDVRDVSKLLHIAFSRSHQNLLTATNSDKNGIKAKKQRYNTRQRNISKKTSPCLHDDHILFTKLYYNLLQ